MASVERNHRALMSTTRQSAPLTRQRAVESRSVYTELPEPTPPTRRDAAVTTCKQKVVLVQQGDRLNTRFRAFDRQWG